jgi:hypothetical protein
VVAAVLVPLFAFSLITRYRDASHTERQQLKWLFLALTVSGIGLAFVWYGAFLVDRQPDGLGLTVTRSRRRACRWRSRSRSCDTPV